MRKFIVLLLYEAYIRKRYLSAFILLVLGVGSLLADVLISSSFSLVGTGYILIFSGLFLAMIIKVVTYIKTRKYI